MASDEFFLAINPDPTKQSLLIEKVKYDLVHDAILENLLSYGPMTFAELGDLVEEQLQNNFDGSVTWLFTAVKLDMEARGEIIRRVPKSKPLIVKEFDGAKLRVADQYGFISH